MELAFIHLLSKWWQTVDSFKLLGNILKENLCWAVEFFKASAFKTLINYLEIFMEIFRCYSTFNPLSQHEKCPSSEFFLFRIFLHWKQKNSELRYFSQSKPARLSLKLLLTPILHLIKYFRYDVKRRVRNSITRSLVVLNSQISFPAIVYEKGKLFQDCLKFSCGWSSGWYMLNFFLFLWAFTIIGKNETFWKNMTTMLINVQVNHAGQKRRGRFQANWVTIHEENTID